MEMYDPINATGCIKLSDSSLDFENRNAIGGLDRVVTNVALAGIAVFPTLGALLFTPWRLAIMLEKDLATGRDGLFLSPGAFFPLSLFSALLVAAVITTPETVQNNGAFLGPALALAVTEAASNGDIWRIVAIVLPIYGFAIAFGLCGRTLTRLAGEAWTLRASLRAAFYATAAVTAWIILSSATIDLFRLKTGQDQFAFLLYSINTVPIIGLSIWIYFWFFRHTGQNTILRSAVLSVLMLALIGAVSLSISWLVSAV